MGLRTPLYELHVALGAKMVDFGGWDMPLHYGSQVEEHHQVRRDCGVFDVSHMTVVDVAGEQATAYLQHLLANDVARLGETGKALYSAMLNEEGGVVDDLIVYLTEHGYRVVVNASTRDKDIAWMRAQAAGFKVDLQERGDLAMLAIQGPNARVHSSELVSPARAALIRELAVPGPCRGRLVHRPHRLHRRGRPGNHAAGRRGAGFPQRAGWRRDLPGGPGMRAIRCAWRPGSISTARTWTKAFPRLPPTWAGP